MGCGGSKENTEEIKSNMKWTKVPEFDTVFRILYNWLLMYFYCYVSSSSQLLMFWVPWKSFVPISKIHVKTWPASLALKNLLSLTSSKRSEFTSGQSLHIRKATLRFRDSSLKLAHLALALIVELCIGIPGISINVWKSLLEALLALLPNLLSYQAR